MIQYRSSPPTATRERRKADEVEALRGALRIVRQCAEVANQGWLMASMSGLKAESNSRTECARLGAATQISAVHTGTLSVPDEGQERIAKAVPPALAAIRP